jgi:RimJ/RimL family protein N-acetyltransferase
MTAGGELEEHVEQETQTTAAAGIEHDPRVGADERSGRIVVVPATAAHLEALIDGPDAFAARFGWRVEPGYLGEEFAAALPHSLDAITDGGIPPEWFSHLFVHEGDAAVIGLGGFKGEPEEGAAEIGYGVAPAYERDGYATEAAQLLIAKAEAAGVTTVIAHTLPERNASTSVLTRLGFTRTQEVVDPDDGTTWRWARTLG